MGISPARPAPSPKSKNRLLVEQSVEDTGPSMFTGQACCDAIDPSLGADVLAKNDHSAIRGQQLVQRRIDRLREGARLGGVSRLSLFASTGSGRMFLNVRTVSATRPGVRGAIGAITSAAEPSRRSFLSPSTSSSISARMSS